ncbi:GntR family transcriptional regulator [Halothiobacillus sp. DCM-1]|uniref:GntR family transcriptional regulator n=1 Tax=Halothiobacillus sp. DCM-1 TaxID=3112558 RepID=UPI00324E57A0
MIRPIHAPPALADQVYAQVKQALFDFTLLPGERFSENQIAESTGASRTPVREALTRLAREGFLSVQNRAGWRVNELDFRRFDQLYELRTVLELAALDKLCQQPAPSVVPELTTIWQVEESTREPEGKAVFALDEAFHAALVAATGNAELADAHRRVIERIRIVRQLDFTEPARIDATYREHAAILQAVARHRSDEACRLMRAHIESSRLAVQKISLHRLYEARERSRAAALDTTNPATGGLRSPSPVHPQGD